MDVHELLGRLQDVTQTNSGWVALCPAHDDRNPSLSVGVAPDGKILLHCFAGCPIERIVAALGLRMTDLFPEARNGAVRNGRPPAKPRPLSVAALAKAKRLPADFLRSLGLRDTPDGVEIPYRNESGTVVAVRTRGRMSGRRRFWWRKGDLPIPYGLDKLREAQTAGFLVLVEGESDAWTLWHHGLPALGIPGASNTRCLEASHLASIDRLYVIREPDRGGEAFVTGVARRLRELDWRGEARMVRLPAKDPSELHCQAPDRFPATFQAALAAAEPLPEPLEEAAAEVAAVADTPAPWLELEAFKFNVTDLGNAGRLVAQHGKDLRYCHPWGKWLVWDGRHWRIDDTAEVWRRAKETVRSIYAEAAREPDDKRREALAKHAVRSESASRISAMIDLARSEPGIPILPHEIDADPYLLGCLNGTLDLRTGKLRPHRREDFITKLVHVEYNPAAECPLWEAFLHRIMAGNTHLIRWLQKAVGYCLTADVSEHVLFIAFGPGANGKSVFLRTLLNLLGPYGKPTDPDLLLARHGEAHPTGIADLMGARLAVTIETDEGRRMNETLVKWLTGGDKLKARFMRQDFFEFEPTFKLWIATNHKPMIRGTDDGIWRRLRLIPFAVTIPEHERDPKLIEKLKAELPGILRWAVEGCLLWQQEGLGMPDEVRAATQAYRQEMDVLAQFLAECCVLEPNAKVFAKHLYPAYVKWCEENGERPLTQTAFGTRMAESGFEKVRWGPGWVYRGVGLLVNGVNGVNGSEPISPMNSKRAVLYTRDAENGFTNRSLFTTREAAAEAAPAADGWEEGEV